ncbi:MAG: hypothetical protein KDA32_07865 [Phycisphaerales bacterium]|nr:hypothetical protein [Phycisphaerales bacterium]
MAGRKRAEKPQSEPVAAELPARIAPMLADSIRDPFDSPKHLYEIKWDGTRCVAFVDRDGLRLQNRRYFELRERYPELECLTKLSTGTVLDGEIVVLENGKPSFNKLLQRDQQREPKKIAMLAKRLPATYIAFDTLFDAGVNVMREPLIERKKRLVAAIETLNNPHVIAPDHVIEKGVAFFEAVAQAGLEGVMAKRLDKAYTPGKRSANWVKIKVAHEEEFDIIGFTQRAGAAVASALVLGRQRDGHWVCYGKVGSGFTEAQRAAFYEQLADAPPLTNPPKDANCPPDAIWRLTGLRCRVQFFEELDTGALRAPVFRGLVE